MAARDDEGGGRRPPWPALLVGAGLIIAVVAGLTALATAALDVVGTPASFARPTPTAPGPITDVTRMLEEPAPESLVGRRVELSETVVVQEVLSEMAVTVGPEDDDVLLVAADEAEGSVGRVEPGQEVRFSGRVERLPPADEARTRWLLPEAATAELSSAEIYVLVETLEVVDAPDD